MRHFKNVFELYRLDWRRIFKNPFATALIIALLIIPSLYAWFNIAALWDPYSNTSELKIAVYSADQTADFEDTSINIGDKLIDSLHDNHSLGWVFVKSKAELDKGVKDGTYYAGIYVPKSFSSDLLSFVKGDLKKPKIEYSVNEKINAIAPKITDKGATTLQETISKEFVATVSQTVVSAFNTIGVDLETNLPSIRKVSSLVLDLEKNLPQIDTYTQEILDLQTKMPDIKAKLTKANEFVEYLPQVNQMTAKISEVNSLMPQLDQTGSLILDLQKNIPQIQNAGRQIAQIDQDFDGIAATLNQGIDEANQALTVIQEVQTIMPDVIELGQDASQTVESTKEVIEKIQSALEPVKQAIDTGLTILKSVASSIGKLADNLSSTVVTEDNKAAIIASLTSLSTHLDTANTMLSGLIDNLEKLQEASGSNELTTTINQLKDLQTRNNELNQKVTALLNELPNLSVAEIQTRLNEISATAKGFVNDLNAIDNAAISQGIQNVLTKLNEALSHADTILNSANTTILPNVESLLASTTGTIKNAVTYLEKYQKELPALKNEIHTANTLLNGNMDLIVGGINKAADFYQNDFPTLKQKLATADDFVKNDLPGIEDDITKTLAMVNEKMPDVENALNSASSLIKNDWPMIRSGIEKAGNFIRDQQENIDLNELIKLLKADAQSESDFLSNPVTMKQKAWYPVPNYGSASAPFYTALCLWVGGLLFSNIASTDFVLSDKDKKRFSKREQYSARMLSFLSVGFFQALIVSLGNLYLLHTYAFEKTWFVAMTIFVGLVFMSILYILAAVFGNLGKGIGIILLVLSISAGGGNFPIQLSGKFFQFINPLLPFTYAVNLLREPVGGIYWPNAWFYALVLLLFGLVFGIFGIIFQPYISVYIKKLQAKINESHFFH